MAVEQLAGPCHVATQSRAGPRGRVAREHRVGEPVDRNHPVAVDQEHRQDSTLTRSTDAQLAAVLVGDTEPTQRVEPDHVHTPFGRVLPAGPTVPETCCNHVATLRRPDRSSHRNSRATTPVDGLDQVTMAVRARRRGLPGRPERRPGASARHGCRPGRLPARGRTGRRGPRQRGPHVDAAARPASPRSP